MTSYEFFEKVNQGIINDEVKAHAAEQMQKIEEDRKKAADRRKKKNDENAPLKKAIYDWLTLHHKGFASDLSDALSTEEQKVSTSKVSSMCRQMEEEGLVTSEMQKSPATKSKAKCYSPVAQEVEAEEETEAEEVEE